MQVVFVEMAATEKFVDTIKCPQCGVTGQARTWQKDGWAYTRDTTTYIESAPEGFSGSDGRGISPATFVCSMCKVEAEYVRD